VSVATLSTNRFDAFLYAAIDDDPNGMPLTVLSALARADLDPWHEANYLLQLGPDAAIQKFASFIRTLPQGTTPRVDADAIATRLIGLLGRSPAAKVQSGSRLIGEVPSAGGYGAPPPAAMEAKPHAFVHYLLFYLLFVAVLIGSQWFSPSSGEIAPPAAAAAAPANGTPSAPGLSNPVR
jgi:hypothetical protein